MQQIKTLEMDAVLLQFWLAGLTGLAEASTLDQRAIWKSVVLVKVVHPSEHWISNVRMNLSLTQTLSLGVDP